ncbi:MAG: tetratricopeptide repeat protein [Rikenellaceae bacterium]
MAIGTLHRGVGRKIIMIVVALIVSVTAIFAQYNKEYFLWMGQRMMINGEYRNAISLLNTLIQRDEREYEGYFLRGIAKYNMGDLLGADSDFSLALEYNPVYTLAFTYRAITRSRLGNYDDALNDFEQAIDLRPDLPDAYYSRGVTRLLNQQFEEAIKDFSLFIRQQNRVADAYLNRGICHLQLRDTVAAYRDFDRAIETNYHSPEGYNRRGSLLLMQSKYREAKSDFDHAIKNDSTHLPSIFNRALVYNYLHKPEDALNDLDRVINLDSLSSITHFNRAIILSQIGDYNSALEDYDRVAELSPNNVLVYFYRANLLSRLGDIEAAEDDYSRAIELYPDFANAYLYRSNLRYLLQDSEGAKRDKELADKKIAQHKSKLRDSSYSIYSDSTYRFDKLLSFDTKLSGANFDAKSGGASGDLALISMFRFTLNRRDTTKIEHHKYYDRRLEEFFKEVNNSSLAISNEPTNMTKAELLKLEKSYKSEQFREQGSGFSSFELGVAQSLIKQYTSSLESLSVAIIGEEENPFYYINRAVTRTEMIEFISSIENSFQRITIDSDPAKRLNSSSVKREYDYGSALADLQQAIELHPTLAYSHYNLGGLLVIQGKLPEAYEAYSEAIRHYPNFAEAYYNRGVVQIMMKDTRKGCIDLSKGGELGVERAYKLLEKYSRVE